MPAVSSHFSPQPTPLPARTYSIWALVSLLASLAVFCPVATLLGPVLALRALVAIKANPQLRGKGVAVAAIIVGLLATLAWAGGALWWHGAVRTPMLRSPLTDRTLRDPAAFNSQFYVADAAPTLADAEAFLSQVRLSIGPIRGATVNDAYQPPSTPQGEFPVSYTIHGEFGDVPATAYFVVFENGRAPLIAAFRWLYVLDRANTAHYYPPQRQQDIILFISQPPASRPSPSQP